MKSLQVRILIAFVLIIAFTVLVSFTFSQLILKRTTDYSKTMLNKQLKDKAKIVESIITSKSEDIVKFSVLLAEQLASHPDVIKGIKTNNKNIIHESFFFKIKFSCKHVCCFL